MLAMNSAPDPFAGVLWHNAQDLGIRGLAWMDEQREETFDRLPTRMLAQTDEKMYYLATNPSGVHIDFVGAPEHLYVRWTMSDRQREDQKMSQLAIAGLDAYGRSASGAWQWLGSKAPWNRPTSDGVIHRGQLDGQDRHYRIYLPPLQRIVALEIGSHQALRPLPAAVAKPIVYYGTSIAQGAGISRAV